MHFSQKIYRLTLALLALAGTSHAAPPTTPLKLWYDHPAANWNEALPVGNGRLGAMVFGTPERERLQLNESTIWAGGPNNNVNPNVLPVIKQLREQLGQQYLPAAGQLAGDKDELLGQLEQAFYFSMVITYAQGMHMLSRASEEFK